MTIERQGKVKSPYENFTQQNNGVIREQKIIKEIGLTGWGVLSAIASFQNEQGEAFPTQDQIADICGISRSTVAKAIKQLEAFRTKDGQPILVKRNKKVQGGGFRKISIYTLLPSSGLRNMTADQREDFATVSNFPCITHEHGEIKKDTSDELPCITEEHGNSIEAEECEKYDEVCEENQSPCITSNTWRVSSVTHKVDTRKKIHVTRTNKQEPIINTPSATANEFDDNNLVENNNNDIKDNIVDYQDEIREHQEFNKNVNSIIAAKIVGAGRGKCHDIKEDVCRKTKHDNGRPKGKNNVVERLLEGVNTSPTRLVVETSKTSNTSEYDASSNNTQRASHHEIYDTIKHFDVEDKTELAEAIKRGCKIVGVSVPDNITGIARVLSNSIRFNRSKYGVDGYIVVRLFIERLQNENFYRKLSNNVPNAINNIIHDAKKVG